MNCRQKNECPVGGKCLEKSIISRATETRTMGKTTYTGLICNEFNSRWGAHKNSFNNIEANQTTLSSYLNKVKSKTVKFDHAKTFNPVTGICTLNTLEKFYNAFKPEGANQNLQSKIFSSCRHTQRMLLYEDKN